MRTPDSRWELRKFPKKKAKTVREYNPADDLCRVIPYRLAQIPEIGEWLMRQRKVKATLNVNAELDVVYRELGEILKIQLLDD